MLLAGPPQEGWGALAMVEYTSERISRNAQKDRSIEQEKLYRRHCGPLCHRREGSRQFLSESFRVSEAGHYERAGWQAHARRVDAARYHPYARSGNARNGRSQREDRGSFTDDAI